MIIPNLMVTDMVRSIGFYRDVLGMTVTMMVSQEKQVLTEGDGEGVIFATLDWTGSQLMLQTVGSLAEELPVFNVESKPARSGWIHSLRRDS